jgi:hypothetical protein
MTITRRRFLTALLLASAGAWMLLTWVEYRGREGPNYSQIEPGLYMGGWVTEPPPGTTAVLNLCENEDPYDSPVRLWEPIRDAGPAPDIDWLRRTVAFVGDQRRAGATTFIHCCRNGVSRSGMVVTAYLMSEHGWTRDEAIAFVRSKRPIVRPNSAFMERLAEWETVLRTSR